VAEATVFRKFGLQELKLRKLSLAAGLAWCLASSVPVCAQDAQPSLADAARAARKDKDKEKDKTAAAPKTVITEDNLSGAPVAGAVAGSPKSGDASATAHSSGGSGSLDVAWARLQATEASLDKLEPLGKSELATTVLNGNSANFPNRDDWVEQLYAAKEIYVQRSRQLIGAMKQVLANMEALQSGDQGKIADNDPRVVSLTKKSQQIMQLAQKTELAFQQTVTQGQNLALQAPR
jgi:hypothetical protein